MLAKFGFSCWNIYVCMACSSPDSPDLSQIRTESVWAKPVPYEQVCASGAKTREHPALSGLQRVSLPKVLPGMPPELGNTRKSPRKQSAQCKLLFEERGRKPLLLAGGANLRVCGEPGAPCAPGELYRTGQCHARTVKGWWVWLAKWISPRCTSWAGGHRGS